MKLQIKPGNPEKAWGRVENFLKAYEARISPVRWFGNTFEGREGVYVLLQLGLLLLALKGAFHTPPNWQVTVANVVAVVFLADILLYNTSVAIVTRRPANVLRSVILTFISYLNLAVAFAVLYSGLSADFSPLTLSCARRALYFSLVTITTLGGNIVPRADAWDAQLLVVAELGVGIYFLVILVARVIAWHAEPREKASPGAV